MKSRDSIFVTMAAFSSGLSSFQVLKSRTGLSHSDDV